MQTRVTQKDLETFASLGGDLPYSPNGNASPSDLVSALVHVLETPSARLAKSAVAVLSFMASQQSLEMLGDVEVSDAARRRLGFLCEALAKSAADDTSARLVELANTLHRVGDSSIEPVTFLAVSPRQVMLAVLKRRGDEVNRRWAVYGGPDPTEYASYL